jgi:hypothetical protein
MYFIPVNNPFGNPPRYVLEDAIDGFVQLGNNPLLVVAFVGKHGDDKFSVKYSLIYLITNFIFLGTILSIAFFNFAGVSVTKELSATTRMVLDSVRTLVIWLVSLAVLWQDFNYLQVIGFILLLIGMCLYNNIIIVPKLERWGLLPSRRPGLTDISPPPAVFAPTPNQYAHDSINSSS